MLARSRANAIFQFPHASKAPRGVAGVYVLGLVNGFVYVGRSVDVYVRVLEHFIGGSNRRRYGALATQRHTPVAILEIVKTDLMDECEQQLTLHYASMAKKRIVYGGDSAVIDRDMSASTRIALGWIFRAKQNKELKFLTSNGVDVPAFRCRLFRQFQRRLETSQRFPIEVDVSFNETHYKQATETERRSMTVTSGTVRLFYNTNKYVRLLGWKPFQHIRRTAGEDLLRFVSFWKTVSRHGVNVATHETPPFFKERIKRKRIQRLVSGETKHVEWSVETKCNTTKGKRFAAPGAYALLLSNGSVFVNSSNVDVWNAIADDFSNRSSHVATSTHVPIAIVEIAHVNIDEVTWCDRVGRYLTLQYMSICGDDEVFGPHTQRRCNKASLVSLTALRNDNEQTPDDYVVKFSKISGKVQRAYGFERAETDRQRVYCKVASLFDEIQMNNIHVSVKRESERGSDGLLDAIRIVVDADVQPREKSVAVKQWFDNRCEHTINVDVIKAFDRRWKSNYKQSPKRVKASPKMDGHDSFLEAGKSLLTKLGTP